MAFHTVLREILEERGVSQSELARRMGVTSQAVNQWVSGTVVPRGARLEHIASALGVDVPNLMGAGRSVLADASRVRKLPAQEFDPEDAPKQTARFPGEQPQTLSRALMPRDVPVFGTAQGGDEGVFHLNTEDGAIDWVRRPPSLAEMKNVFAVYVEGESMVPWRQSGELVYVHPTRPASPGCHVIAEYWSAEKGIPPVAFIKQLRRRTSADTIFWQYNPPMEVTLPTANIRRLYRVIEWTEILGV